MRPLKPLGERGEETTLEELEDAIRDAKSVPESVTARVTLLAKQDVADLRPELERRAVAQIDRIKKDLIDRGEVEAASLQRLLQVQRDRIAKASRSSNPDQFELFNEEERKQHEADRRHWANRLQHLQQELRDEPHRVRRTYEVRAHRLEPTGLVYLWPASR
jgi:hypothetical protein